MDARPPGRIRRAWRALRRLVRRPEPPPEPPWPDEELAPVPVSPRGPRPSAAAAVLEPPREPDALEYPVETDAVGPLPNDDEDDVGGLRAAAN